MSGLIAPAPPPMRQTVLSAPLDSAGRAATLINDFTDTVTVAAPLVMTAAGGFGESGAVDIVRRLNAAGSVVLGGASQWHYVYADLSEGVVFGSTALVPLYRFSLPAAPVVDQHVFIIPEEKMYRWDGAAWVQVYRVLVGRALVLSGTVAAVESFAVRDFYDSGEFTIAANTDYLKYHSVLNSVIWPGVRVWGYVQTAPASRRRPLMQIDTSGTSFYGDAVSLGSGDGLSGSMENAVYFRTPAAGPHPLVGAGLPYPDAAGFDTAVARVFVSRGF